MTDKRDEALKLALEALERMKGYGDVFLCRSHEQKPFDQVCEAITAIREALAHAPTEREQPAQQEPIAWIYKPHMELLWPDEIEVKDPSKHTGYKPVYTSPPNVPTARASKPWTGLTDEQSIVIWANSQSTDEAIRATEKQLKENNK